jgi:[ribosomal protein S5]-alanine N-acetyltransferase
MFPVLETDRLFLREINVNDVDRIYHILSNPIVTQFYGREPIETDDHAQEIVQHFMSLPTEKKGLRWGIERKEEKGLIGTIGFHLWSAKYKRAEIGYELDPQFWSSGYVSEAIQHVITYGFKEMELNRIGAIVYLENDASNNLLKKFGFQNEGIKREYMYQGGKFYDTYSYSLLKSDFLGGKSK